MTIAVECVVRGTDTLGECTVWCERDQLLWWVDIRAPSLKSFDPSTGAIKVLTLKEAIGSFGLTESGERVVAALKSGLYLLDPRSGVLELLAAPEKDNRENRFNDGRCDRAGRFWAGTMRDPNRTPTGSLYRLDPNRRCIKMRGEVTEPNSLAWSPDDQTMYFADTHRSVIWSYNYDIGEGQIYAERVFADTNGQPGRPDGSCVDADGGLWNAEYGGWRVVRYRPDGRIDQVVQLPVSNPTC